MSVCPSVGRSVRPSVTLSFFGPPGATNAVYTAPLLVLAACTVFGISGSLVYYSTAEFGFSDLQLISSDFCKWRFALLFYFIFCHQNIACIFDRDGNVSILSLNLL